MHFTIKGSIRTRKKDKWILLQKKTLDKQGCLLYYKKLKTTQKMEFVIIQTTTRKNNNEFYINKNIMTRKTHGN
jgi:ribosomal protein L35AE/L33A